MITIHKDRCDVDGKGIDVINEFSSIFFHFNAYLDGHDELLTEFLEEAVVCSETTYKEMQKLMVRLSKAHDRAVENKKKGNLKF